MKKETKKVIIDCLIVLICFWAAWILVRSGIVGDLLLRASSWGWIGAIVAGIFYVSFFTIPFSIAIILEMTKFYPVWLLAVLGGLGSVLGDAVIFCFVKDRLSGDIFYILNKLKCNKVLALRKYKLVRLILCVLGAIVVALPLPDEVGLTLMGLSKMKTKTFIIATFLLNGLGILAVGLAIRLF